MEVVASLSQGRTVAAQCGLFTHKSVPVIFEPPCAYWDRKCLQVKMSVITNLTGKIYLFPYNFLKVIK